MRQSKLRMGVSKIERGNDGTPWLPSCAVRYWADVEVPHGASGRLKNYGFREALVSGMTVAVVGLVCSSQLS